MNIENLSEIKTVLPIHEEGNSKGRIDWKATIGMTIELNHIEYGFIKIVIADYIKEKQELIVKYNYQSFNLKTEKLKRGKIGKLFNVRTKEFKVNIGSLFGKNKEITITHREYRNNPYNVGKKLKWYKYTCNKCGWREGWIEESNLLKGQGCSCCYGRTAVLGINTIWDTDRWMVDLGVSEEDAKKYTKTSNKKIEVTCLDCGKVKNMRVCSIYKNKSISCNCSDGFSYPEKFTTNLLTQLEVKFEPQYSPKWADNKRYDFYIPSLNMIIETHGEQHYIEMSIKGARTLKEEQENDKLKRKLALSNGVKYYIELNCSKSELDWIKASVSNSKLSELFNLESIYWLNCEKFALKNIVREICTYWDNRKEGETVYSIVENNKWGIKSVDTIRRYLKAGEKQGWCNYSEKRKIQVCREGEIIYCSDVNDIIEYFKFNYGIELKYGGIMRSCSNGSKYRGCIFSYVVTRVSSREGAEL